MSAGQVFGHHHILFWKVQFLGGSYLTQALTGCCIRPVRALNGKGWIWVQIGLGAVQGEGFSEVETDVKNSNSRYFPHDAVLSLVNYQHQLLEFEDEDLADISLRPHESKAKSAKLLILISYSTTGSLKVTTTPYIHVTAYLLLNYSFTETSWSIAQGQW